MWFLVGVHVYIVLHMWVWYFTDIKIWGKTAMVGVPSLLSGNINAAAIMVVAILVSIPILERRFCGWVCHLRGAIELSEWIILIFNPEFFNKKNRKGWLLLNTRYRWLLRFGALYVLLLPVIVGFVRKGWAPKMKAASLEPMVDLPGHANLLFKDGAPINTEILDSGIAAAGAFNLADFALALGTGLGIIFVMSFVLSCFYGRGAFCRCFVPIRRFWRP